MLKMHFLYGFPFSTLLLFSVVHLFLSRHPFPFLALPVPSFLTPFVNFSIFNSVCLSEKFFSFLFSLLKITQWKELMNQWGVRASAEKDLVRKLSANTYKMSSKNQLLTKLNCYYFFSFWTIMLSIADKCMYWNIGVFPPVIAFFQVNHSLTVYSLPMMKIRSC